MNRVGINAASHSSSRNRLRFTLLRTCDVALTNSFVTIRELFTNSFVINVDRLAFTGGLVMEMH